MENNGKIYQLKGKALLSSNSHHSLEAKMTTIPCLSIMVGFGFTMPSSYFVQMQKNGESN
jgi:hypothetical protein